MPNDREGWFVKKPIPIQAWLWNETNTLRLKLEAVGMCTGWSGHVDRPDECKQLRINTLEGWLSVLPGDWIIRGVRGEFYPCRSDIFEETYVAAALAADREQRETPKPDAEIALDVIERIAGDDETEEWEFDLYENRLSGPMKSAVEKILRIYRYSHSMSASHSCYQFHKDWRLSCREAYAEIEKERTTAIEFVGLGPVPNTAVDTSCKEKSAPAKEGQ